MTPAKLCLAQSAMGWRETGVSALYAEPGSTRQTLYRYVDPRCRLRSDDEKLLRHWHTEQRQELLAGSGEMGDR